TALGSTMVSTAIFPYFSKQVSQKDWNGLEHTLKRYTQLIMLIGAPLALLGVIFTEPLTRLVLQRGAFTAADTLSFSQVQAYFALQGPLFVIMILYTRLVSSLKNTQVLVPFAIAAAIINFVTDFLLMKAFGVSGIALSTILVYLFNCAGISIYV